MNETFNSKLERVVRQRASHLCVGLDPDFDKIRQQMWELLARKMQSIFASVEDLRQLLPSQAPQDVEAILENKPELVKQLACAMTMDATFDYAAAYKPNAAFFELEESVFGMQRPEDSDEVLMILDAKRGDIGNSSAQYARAILEDNDYDAVTVNPLMGWDSVEPFLRDPQRGVFLLCLTSNPGAQDFLLRNELYKRIAEKAAEWNRNGNVGLVVGATRAEHAAAVRQIAPELALLVPGVGAQGGSLEEILDAIGARDNRRFLINASRSIMFPGLSDAQPQEYLLAVADAARKLRDEINALL